MSIWVPSLSVNVSLAKFTVALPAETSVTGVLVPVDRPVLGFVRLVLGDLGRRLVLNPFHRGLGSQVARFEHLVAVAAALKAALVAALMASNCSRYALLFSRRASMSFQAEPGVLAAKRLVNRPCHSSSRIASNG